MAMKQLDPLVNLWPKGRKMRGSMQDNAALAAEAYLAWWNLAGVSVAVGETPVDWLRPAGTSGPAMVARPASLTPAERNVITPHDLPSFHNWLATDANQVERRWPGRPVMPSGEAGAALMIVTDMPDPADVEAGNLLTDRAGALLDAMLAAVGLARSQCYVASLFCARAPGGMVEATDLVAVAARMRTHVHLARPRRLLLLGDRTARALMPDTSDRPTDGLRDFNHDGGILPAIATFHPRLLLGQPAAKAGCWRTLQYLIEEPRP